MSNDETKTLEGGLEITVVKFDSFTAFALFGRIRKLGDSYVEDPAFMADMLASSYVVRIDDGQKSRIDICDKKTINRAFAGYGIETLIEALNFSVQVNFGSFFEYGQRKVAALAAATTPVNP